MVPRFSPFHPPLPWLEVKAAFHLKGSCGEVQATFQQPQAPARLAVSVLEPDRVETNAEGRVRFVSSAILRMLVDEHGASDGAFWVLDEDGGAAHAAAWMKRGAFAEHLRGPYPALRVAGPHAAMESLRKGTPLFMQSHEAAWDHPMTAAILQRYGSFRFAMLPMVEAGQVPGAAALSWEGARDFTDAEQRRLRQGALSLQPFLGEAVAADRRAAEETWARALGVVEWKGECLDDACTMLVPHLADEATPFRAAPSGALVDADGRAAPPAAQDARLDPLMFTHAAPAPALACDAADFARLEGLGAHAFAFAPVLSGGRRAAVVRLVRHRTRSCLGAPEERRLRSWMHRLKGAMQSQGEPLRRGDLFRDL